MSCNPTTLASILGVLCLPTHLHLVVAYDRNKYRPPPPTQLATTRTRTLIHIAITTYPYILVSQTKPPTMATGAEAACVVCGGPAHNKCGACKLDTSSRHYCGKACQVKDWPTHKKACKDIQNADLEKKLTRVANIVQQGYYGFRKNTWDIPIVKVDRLGNNDLVLYISVPLSVSHANYISEFPQHLVSDKLTENAMLCALVRSEPATWMYSIIGELTKGKIY